MNSTIVSDGQSLLDVALQELGDVAAAFDLADANELAITSALTPGQMLQVPASLLSRPEVAAYFTSHRQRINTGDTAPSFTPPQSPRRDFSPLDYSSNDFI
jgi:hypothetical protein